MNIGALLWIALGIEFVFLFVFYLFATSIDRARIEISCLKEEVSALKRLKSEVKNG